MNKIFFTGGGTAGHIVPNLVLIRHLKKEGWEIGYIGSEAGMEKQLVVNEGIKYYAIATGKLRRYFDLKNFTDPFRVIKGIIQATSIISKNKPDVLFSKGGFVTVPVVIAAWLNKVPVISHESDMTPGLANKISMRFSKKLCVNFPETLKYIPKNKGILTGTPIRDELFKGNRQKGLEICKFDNGKPVLLLIGGSSGSKYLNELLRGSLNVLLKKFQVIHVCGKDNLNDKYNNKEGYRQFEYLNDEISDIFAAADIVVSRAGANTIYELIQLCKPNILIPLSAKVSRGDQILNARSFEKQGFSKILDEDTLDESRFIEAINEVLANKEMYIKNMKKSKLKDGKKLIIDLIKETAKKE